MNRAQNRLVDKQQQNQHKQQQQEKQQKQQRNPHKQQPGAKGSAKADPKEEGSNPQKVRAKGVGLPSMGALPVGGHQHFAFFFFYFPAWNFALCSLWASSEFRWFSSCETLAAPGAFARLNCTNTNFRSAWKNSSITLKFLNG